MAELNSEKTRADRIDRLADGSVEVLVIGGGIVGAGIARDAAMRGLRVGLVEQCDFASGTSSRTSRLLHGGLRYLAQGRLKLVYQASHEKRILHRIASHLADPLPFLFPTYRGTEWPLWKMRIGVKLYDLLCGGQNLGPSSGLGRDATLGLLPGLAEKSLTGAVRYFDGLTNDARLTLDTLRSAVGHGAVAVNYCRVEEVVPGASGWIGHVRDLSSSGTGFQPVPDGLESRPTSGRVFQVRSRSVVNATGPWGSRLPQSRLQLRLTKGVHLVLDRIRLPVPDAVVMTDEGRILFAIPWGERVILGTTDTDYDGPIEAVRTEPADVAYILDIANRCFPKAGLTPADVLSSWAGLRPLLADKRGGPSDISRAHSIAMGEPGWLDVAGGKLTTYRLIAEEAVDRLVAFLDVKAPRCATAQEPLLPSPDATRGSAIVPPEPSAELVEHYCTREWAVHLADVMIRRTSWHYYRKDRLELADRVAGWMAGTLGWEPARLAAEQARYREE